MSRTGGMTIGNGESTFSESKLCMFQMYALCCIEIAGSKLKFYAKKVVVAAYSVKYTIKGDVRHARNLREKALYVFNVSHMFSFVGNVSFLPFFLAFLPLSYSAPFFGVSSVVKTTASPVEKLSVKRGCKINLVTACPTDFCSRCI